MLQKINSRSLFTSSILKKAVKLAFTSHEEKLSAEKPPIVVMHGLFGSKNNWNLLGKLLNHQTERRVIAIDARNHGESPHSSEFTYKSMAEDIVTLLDDLRCEKSVLIGHSMGGAVMMFAALHYPSIVEKLVVIDMSPIKISPILQQMGKLIKYMLSTDFDGLNSLDEAKQRIDEHLAKSISSIPIRQYLLANIIEEQPGIYKWRVNVPAIEKNFQTQLSNIPLLVDDNKENFNGPTLIVAGSKSAYIEEEDHKKISKFFTNLKIENIQGAGHFVHADKPNEFLKVSTEFINN